MNAKRFVLIYNKECPTQLPSRRIQARCKWFYVVRPTKIHRITPAGKIPFGSNRMANDPNNVACPIEYRTSTHSRRPVSFHLDNRTGIGSTIPNPIQVHLYNAPICAVHPFRQKHFLRFGREPRKVQFWIPHSKQDIPDLRPLSVYTHPHSLGRAHLWAKRRCLHNC